MNRSHATEYRTQNNTVGRKTENNSCPSNNMNILSDNTAALAQVRLAFPPAPEGEARQRASASPGGQSTSKACSRSHEPRAMQVAARVTPHPRAAGSAPFDHGLEGPVPRGREGHAALRALLRLREHLIALLAHAVALLAREDSPQHAARADAAVDRAPQQSRRCAQLGRLSAGHVQCALRHGASRSAGLEESSRGAWAGVRPPPPLEAAMLQSSSSRANGVEHDA